MSGSLNLKERALNLALLLCALFAFFFNAWVSEDAFITFRVIDNFLNGHGLRWNVSERVQVFTHPLWMLLLTPLVALLKSPFFSSLLLSLVFFLLTIGAILKQLSRPLDKVAAIFLLLHCRSFLDYSSAGLENALLGALLLGLFIKLGLAPVEKRYASWGLFGALLFLTRPDVLFLMAPWFLYDVYLHVRRSNFAMCLKQLIIFSSPAFAWLLFATLYFGSPLPNTALAKAATQLPMETLFQQGLHFLKASALFDPMGAVTLILGSIVLWRDTKQRGFLFGVLFFLLYVVMVGGDYMAGRFLSHLMPILSLVIVNSFVSLGKKEARFALLIGVAVMTAQTFRGLSPFMRNPEFHSDWRSVRGVEDQRGFYYQKNGLLSKNRHHADDVAFYLDGTIIKESIERNEMAVGRRVPATYIVCNVGAVGFAAGAKAHIIDPFALTDPLLSRLPSYPLFRPGHFERLIPRGYARAIETGDDSHMPPEIRNLWHLIQWATRSEDYFSFDRLTAIWKLNSISAPNGLKEGAYARELNERSDQDRVLGCIDPLVGQAPIKVNQENVDRIGIWRPGPGIHWNPQEFRIP